MMTMYMKWNIVFMFLLFPVMLFSQTYSVEIPYESVKDKMIVKATVDGIEGRYIFDTGAPVCLTYSRAQEATGKSVESVESVESVDANGQKSVFEQVQVGQIQLGALQYVNVKVPVLEKNNLLECFGVDGIIGANLFAGAVVRIDSRRGVVCVASSADAFHIPARNQVSMQTSGQNTPYVNVSLGMGLTDKVMFDTGFGGFYSMGEDAYLMIAHEEAIVTLSKGFGSLNWGVGGIEKATPKYRVKIPDLRIGVGKFRNATTLTTRGGKSLLGAKILPYGIVTLDFKNMAFSFEPYETAPVNMEKKEWNVDITLSGENLLIAGCVWESAKDLLPGGSRVVEIDGQRFGKLDPCEVLTSRVVKLDGEEAVIVFLDQEGKEKRVTIRKE